MVRSIWYTCGCGAKYRNKDLAEICCLGFNGGTPA